MNLSFTLHLFTLYVIFALLHETHAISRQTRYPNKISPALQQKYAHSPVSKYTVIIHMRNGPKAAGIMNHPNLQRAKYATRGAHISALVSALEKHSAASQSRVCDHLDYIQAPERKAGNSNLKSRLEYAPIWMSNKVVVKNVDLPTCEKLAAIHDEIEEIHEDRMLNLYPHDGYEYFENVNSNSKVPASNPVPGAWGVRAIRAPDVWRTLHNTGEGILVATIDTGVNKDHVLLKHNYIGDPYGWFDPVNGTLTSNDREGGHGTHTMGTLVGRGGIGVAPGATWMTCKACAKFSCPNSALLTCLQYILCPTLLKNSTNYGKEYIERDCSRAPHVLSCSWGGDPDPKTDPEFFDELSTIHAAGIIPVFAIGNSGPKCGTAGNPGGFSNVIGIGATNKYDHVANFSSCGNQTRPDFALPKPDCTAPGVNITSASNLNNGGYRTLSGTSMATPHAAGVVTLMLSKNPDLTFEEIRGIIYASTVRRQGRITYQRNPLYLPVCGKPTSSESRFPNNCDGWGGIDALNCVINTPNPRMG